MSFFFRIRHWRRLAWIWRWIRTYGICIWTKPSSNWTKKFWSCPNYTWSKKIINWFTSKKCYLLIGPKSYAIEFQTKSVLAIYKKLEVNWKFQFLPKHFWFDSESQLHMIRPLILPKFVLIRLYICIITFIIYKIRNVIELILSSDFNRFIGWCRRFLPSGYQFGFFETCFE